MERPIAIRSAPIGLGALGLSGCSASPSQNVFGSFFPAWMLAAAMGVAAAVAARQLLGAAGIDRHVWAPPLTYLCIAVAATLAIWLVWFGN